MWNLETERVYNYICNSKAKKVILQAPEGLKRSVDLEISKLRQKFIEYNTKPEEIPKMIIWGESCFGACDLCDREVSLLNPDLIVHYGHEELSYVKSEIPVIYVHAYYNVDEDFKKNMEKLQKELNNPTIVSTVQFKKCLEEYDPNIILGCRAVITNWKNDESILYVGTGRFHPLMMAYKFKKTVKIYNPLSQEVSEITESEIKKMIKIRIGKITKLMLNPPKKVGIVLSTKKGQCRAKVFEKMIELCEENKIEYTPIVLNNISPSNLIYKVDAYVICACPRIVLDDYSNYDKTLVTAREFEMYVKEDFEYIFDEVMEHDFL
ncbi:diphthamide biosynthesis enzyme Dph2 [Methanococcus voltae]|uniref:2-(3-amino-3-carboxypropyl)histidine synthase n=1 Tax=Methanococcus voltae TaxID=2188 RepID=A0A8J7S5L1_METVO|nr:diphthamide biosynthesis enzyme Dph2 [Methanococcus voltae]MBP2172777.1 2-(3-amino-3-carboxypropyl)histidine synthase [Methanococcus voltae]MBP2201813.1 2-(3-amino-3-carboxypropyl)histidine synthase [Methanococcus voltae]